MRLSCFKQFFIFYLYILYSASSDKYYVGYTENVERRLDEHNRSNRITYTSKHRPWILKKFIVLDGNRSFAMGIEKAVKKAKSKIVIEKIILTINSVEELAQLVRVPTSREAQEREQKSLTEMKGFFALSDFGICLYRYCLLHPISADCAKAKKIIILIIQKLNSSFYNKSNFRELYPPREKTNHFNRLLLSKFGAVANC